MAYSLTFYEGRETIVQFVPEPGSDAEGLVGTGRTRCAPSDSYQPEVGQRIAFGRALVDLGRHIESEGLSAVVSNEDVQGLLDKIIKESVSQARKDDPQHFDSEIAAVQNAIAEEDIESETQPDERLHEDTFDPATPHVPEGIEKWVREHGYRLEVNDQG